MSGDQLTPGERLMLAALGAAPSTPALDIASLDLAGLMRETFPGVSDVVLAKVTLLLARVCKSYIHVNPDVAAYEITGLMARMAWVLAEVELETTP